MRLLILCCSIALIAGPACIAQESTTYVTVPADSTFKISKSRTWWMGYNYRQEWKTPIRVRMISFATEKGGLKVVKRGGGKQTRSLRVADPTGKEYNIRSIQKFVTSETLPGDLQSEAAEDLVADGISASYPYAQLSVATLAQAANIPYLNAEVVYIGDDPGLGEYRKDFSHLVAYLEERVPDSVKKGHDTEDVIEKMEEDPDNTADQYALLRARILDMFVMDLDRHEGQWEWGAIDKEKGKLYFPIPKDRDQAFYINEGVLPHIVQWPWLVPQLEGFKAKSRNIERFNFAARNFDRYFLNRLTEADWSKAVNDFLPLMTDQVIENAVAQQPIEIRYLSTAEIANKLKERRKYLAAEVMQYYRFLADIVTVTGSNKPEEWHINRNNDGSVLLQVYKINREGARGDVYYERLFDPKYTKELRLYGLDGNDRFIVTGTDDKIKVRMIGGKGSDHFENATSGGAGGWVYDTKGDNSKLTGRLKNKITNDTVVTDYKFVNYHYNKVIPFISAGFNPDDGVYLGLYLKFIRHGFGKDPYKNSHTFSAMGALTGAFNVRYGSEFIGVFGRRSDLLLDADIKVPNITNFFGYGTNSIYDKGSPGKFRYYRTRYTLGDLSIQLRKRFSEKVIITLGPVFQFYNMDSTDRFNRKRNITQADPADLGINPATAFDNQSYAGGRFSLTIDTRNNRIIPRKGIFWQTSVRYLSGLNDNSYDNLTQLNSDFTFHINIIDKVMTFANRFGGGHNFGDFEFYNAQYLGNDDNLRGYRKYRFAGRSKFYNNAELRIALANFKTYLFPGSLGIFGFYDTGRIWVDDEFNGDGDDSNKWLAGYGGGFWISPLRRMVVTLTAAVSEEDFVPSVGIGWKF